MEDYTVTRNGRLRYPSARKMYYQITFRRDHLKAELFARETTEETGEFLGALAAGSAKYRCSLILISVHRSKPVFTVGRYGLLSYFDMALRSLLKIALVGDSAELRIAHQYIESLALQRGVSLRAFRDEAIALHWLRAERTKKSQLDVGRNDMRRTMR